MESPIKGAELISAGSSRLSLHLLPALGNASGGIGGASGERSGSGNAAAPEGRVPPGRGVTEAGTPLLTRPHCPQGRDTVTQALYKLC